MAEQDFDAHRRIRETARVGVAELWDQCETAFGADAPVLALFDNIFEKLVVTALAKGAKWPHIVTKLDEVMSSGGSGFESVLDDE